MCAMLQPHPASVTFLNKVQVDPDGDAILGIPSVVQVIAVPAVIDIHIIVFVPIVRPVLWPRINNIEINAAV